MTVEVSLEFIGRSLRDLHDEMRDMRAEFREMRTGQHDVRAELRDVRGEVRDMRSVVLQGIDQTRHVRDDLELMIRSESMGRAARFETMFERALDEIRDRIVALETADR